MARSRTLPLSLFLLRRGGMAGLLDSESDAEIETEARVGAAIQ
jgi:hypothetical protein